MGLLAGGGPWGGVVTVRARSGRSDGGKQRDWTSHTRAARRGHH